MHVFSARSTSNVIHRTGLAPRDDNAGKKNLLMLTVQLEEDAMCLHAAPSFTAVS